MGAFEFIDGDFNADGVYSCADVDALVAEIVAATHDVTYDLNSDHLVNHDDLDTWLAVAGVANLDSHDPYLLGDANLDGVVDGLDFLEWNAHKFTYTGLWSKADWNADGVTDGLDFLIWNGNKFQSSGVPVLRVLHQPHDFGDSAGALFTTAIRRIDLVFADYHQRDERGDEQHKASVFDALIDEFSIQPYVL